MGNRPSKTCKSIPTDANSITGKYRLEYKNLCKQYRKQSFTDDKFPTNRSSLYRLNEDYNSNYDQLVKKWLRINQINYGFGEDAKNSKVSVYGPKLDISLFRQGKLGDCWLVSSLASLVYQHPSHIKILIPNSEINPSGFYQIFLCIDGNWSPIVVDDYFPCNQNGQMVFTEVNEKCFN